MRYLIIAFILFASTPAFAKNAYQEIADPMTDVKRGIAAINVDGIITPVVKCDKSGPGSMYISFISKEYLGAVRYKTRSIKVRFDSEEPYEVSAYHDGRTANLFDLAPGKAAGSVLSNMMNKSRMVVQLTTYDYKMVTDAFDLGDSREVIMQSIKTCQDSNWTGL